MCEGGASDGRGTIPSLRARVSLSHAFIHLSPSSQRQEVLEEYDIIPRCQLILKLNVFKLLMIIVIY